MSYKVCIPTAGIGSRVDKFSRVLTSLIEIENKPAICYIIEKYIKESEFIILLGYSYEVKPLKINLPKKYIQIYRCRLV